MSHDIYDILQRLDEGLNPQQRSVPQLPALFKPKSISVLGTGKDPEHPMHGYAVGANESAEEPTTEAEVIPIRPSGVKFINKKDYLDKRDVIFRILSQPGLDPETKEELKTRLADFEQAAKAQGLITESDETNPMRRAVMHRIVNQHPEWITKYGAEALVQAIDDVTEGEDDWEEIGSSDVSAYVHYVKDALDDRMGGREEMDDRQPFAEQGVSEGVSDVVKGAIGGGMLGGGLGLGAELTPGVAWGIPTLAGTAFGAALGAWKAKALDNPIYQVYVNGKKTSDTMGGNDAARLIEKLARKEHDTDTKFTIVNIKTGDIVFRKTWSTDSEQTGGDPGWVGNWSGKENVERGIQEAATTEDVISTVKRKLGDYLQDVATAIKKDPDLLDKVEQAIDQVGPAVKTIQTDDGHEIKIHGNEDDGFRISIKNQPGKSKFKTLDEATMACEMYCAHRRQKAMSADYIEEKHIS